MTEHNILAAVPLKYTYLLRPKANEYLYQSSVGLWSPVDANNQLICYLLGDPTRYEIIDNMFALDGCQITVCESRGKEYLLQLTTESRDVTAQHKKALDQYRRVEAKSLTIEKSCYGSLFENDGSLKNDWAMKLSTLAQFCGVEIIFSSRSESFSPGIPSASTTMTSDKVYIYIIGPVDDILFGETRLRILLDDALGLFVDSIPFPLSLIPLVGGIGFGNFKSVAKETGVNLYLPSLVTSSSSIRDLNHVYASGLEPQVALTKKLLNDVKDVMEVNYKNLQVLKYKKDFILLNFSDEINAIMYKYGVFIKTSTLGDDDSLVHFQGNSKEMVEDAILEFTLLMDTVCVTDLWLHNDDNPADPKDIDELKMTLTKISIASNVCVYADIPSSSFKLIGSQDDSLKALRLFKTSASNLYEKFEAKIKLQLELGASHHEFISGKKNGKISKITNMSKCSLINFHALNDYSMLIDLESMDFNDFFKAFGFLRDELPSESKFYIPESFHRQIIGTGGSLIQSIMRKYNVFVKFSNSFELKNNKRGLVRYDNVIIRCPFKNSSNIPLVKDELNNLLMNNEGGMFYNTYVKLSRNQFRLFDYDKVQEIERKTSTFMKFPQTEPLDFNIVEILGVETSSVNATRLLIGELAESYEFRVTWSAQFHKLVTDSNEEFVEKIKFPFKVVYGFEIMMFDAKTADNVPYHSIVLSYVPNDELHLEDAITHLTAFLRENKFMILDRAELSSNDLIINGTASRYTASDSTAAFSFAIQPTYQHPYPQYGLMPITQPALIQQPQQSHKQKKRPSTHSGFHSRRF